MLHATRATSLAEIKVAIEEALGPGSVELVGDGQIAISGVTEDSRRSEPGCLFVAKVGLGRDGLSFLDVALAAGAVAVLTGRTADVGFVPRLVVSDVPAALAHAAEWLAGRPSRALRVVGITGTNGKTTTAALVAQALGSAGRKVARLGTLGLYLEEVHVRDTLTTPGAEDLAECLRLAVRAGVTDFVMEVSSHALAQGRVLGVSFGVAAFSNLSQDHLDYHGSMAEYGAAKARLFESGPTASVINVADDFGRELAGRTPGALTVSLDARQPADVVAKEVHLSQRGTVLHVTMAGQDITLTSPLLGEFNAENLLLALGILTKLGLSPALAATHLGQASAVAGRLERVDGPADDVVALVDYAHTPDAVVRVLGMARALGPSHIVCVLGCGGDRDRKKRPLMGRAAAEGADEVWITTDNPRSEDPAQIAREVLAGTSYGSATVLVELDRKQAIKGAISAAPPGAMVLVLGKGHETYQLVGTKVLDFDDRLEVKTALAGRRENRS
jgi:UDP-N-acetylmuramoyl-L-alanyl-D-glutamate--2,6-diaminopimelate ligase